MRPHTNMKRLLRIRSLITPLLFTLASAPDALAYYDSGVQRWFNRDPLGMTPAFPLENSWATVEEIEGATLFGFTRNDPLGNFDDDGSMAHRKKRPSTHDKHARAMGRPKAGARSGKAKPNMAQNQCKCPPSAAALALTFTLDAACQEVPDPEFPDENGSCPKGTCPIQKEFLFFKWVQCLPCS